MRLFSRKPRHLDQLRSWWVQCQQPVTTRLQPAPDSVDYRAWRHRFMLDRLSICLWVAVIGHIATGLVEIYRIFINTSQFRNEVTQVLGDASLFDRFQVSAVFSLLSITILLVICAILLRTCWGQRRPELVFLSFAISISLIPDQIIPLLFGLPSPPNTFIFMAQAILIPVYWRLHLVSQLLPIFCYVGVYPLLGLTKVGTFSIYSPGFIVQLLLVCVICDLGVYLYERLKRSEFDAQRRLHVFFHTIAHELRTPVMGSSMLLRSLLPKATNGEVLVKTEVIEQLAAGNDRLLSLMNSLLDTHASELSEALLQREPTDVRSLVDSVLADLQPLIAKNRIHLMNAIQDDLPAIAADPQHLWRVWCNLINNALKHNPPGIDLKLTAEVLVLEQGSLPSFPGAIYPESPPKNLGHRLDPAANQPRHALPLPRAQLSWLCCRVQDSGVGISGEQCQRIFELYSRGTRDRYTPGLGLGLYVCRQIIKAHGGQIGVISHPGKGSTFWFTLPLVEE